MKDPDVIEALAKIHDDLAGQDIARLQHAADDPVRHAIDAAVHTLYGIDETTVHKWRRLLSQEPFNHNAAPDETYDGEPGGAQEPDLSTSDTE